jgi:hypothetical protein
MNTLKTESRKIAWFASMVRPPVCTIVIAANDRSPFRHSARLAGSGQSDHRTRERSIRRIGDVFAL